MWKEEVLKHLFLLYLLVVAGKALGVYKVGLHGAALRRRGMRPSGTLTRLVGWVAWAFVFEACSYAFLPLFGFAEAGWTGAILVNALATVALLATGVRRARRIVFRKEPA